MVITIDDSIEIISENEEVEHIFVFTQVSAERQGTVYTAVIGEKAYINNNSKATNAVEADLSAGGLYIISIGPDVIASRVYGGVVRFEQESGIYFAVVFPEWTILDKLEPAQRWKFRYISFEYPRKGKKGFLLPTINCLPFAYCFITQEERQIIEHLCPPMPVARYLPAEYGYKEEELSRYLTDEQEKSRHADELYPIIESIFVRSKGNKEQYLPMSKNLLPQQYRDYQMLYNANSLWDW